MIFFSISSDSVVMSPFSLLILFIRMMSLCPLVSLAKGLSIVLILSKQKQKTKTNKQKTAPGLVDSLYSSFCFHLVDFSPEFDYFLPPTPHG